MSRRLGNCAHLEFLEGRRLLIAAADPGLASAADISGDGRTDFVSVAPSATAGQFKLTMSVGDGRGGFRDHATQSLELVQPVAALSFGGQSPTSIIIDRTTSTPANWLAVNTSVLVGSEVSTWRSLLPQSAFANNTTSSWAYGNINNDAFPDLVSLDRTGVVRVFAGGWGFNYSEPVMNFAFWGGDARQLTLGDFDGDGWTDMAAVTNSGVQMAPAIGGNPCAPAFTVPMGSAQFLARSLTAGDLNRDGRQDLAVGLSDGGVLSVMQMPNGVFASPLRTSNILNSPNARIHGTDVDADGDADLVIVAGMDAKKPLTVARNNGSGVFSFTPIRKTPDGALTTLEQSSMNQQDVI